MRVEQFVIGRGEVGSALQSVLGCPGRDVADASDITNADVLHICFPHRAEFERQVVGYADGYDADLVIVHSTVPVGTCDPHGWVHSPVRGRHPHLERGLRTFLKHAGGARALEAATVMEQAGIAVEVTPLARTTEAGKLWELVQFGLQVIVEQEMRAWCERVGADPDVAYRRFAETYNIGYAALGDDRFVRPVLEHDPGPIGGHCIAQSAPFVDHPIARAVARWRGVDA